MPPSDNIKKNVMKSAGCSTNIVDWLLGDDTPGAAFLARTRLLDESPDSRRMTSLRRRCDEYAPVATMLGRVDDAIAAGDYNKYRGAYWTLIFLADMHADGGDPRARKLAQHVLATQLESGGFAPSGTPRWEIVCLTANVLRSLVHFGYGDDESVVRGYKRLAERILPHGGVPCVVLETCLHTSCKMALPQTLRCLSVAPPGTPKGEMKKLTDLLIRQMLEVRVFQYFRPDVKAWREASKNRPKGVTERVIRLKWLHERQYDNDELLPKPGWKRFGFPRSYNPDMLEAMWALAEAGAKYDPAMNDALEHIESKRLPDGRWKMDDSLNGKMLANVEKKGKPSKWITLRAMRVLKHFGRAKCR